MVISVKHARWTNPDEGEFVIDKRTYDVVWMVAVVGDSAQKRYGAAIYQVTSEAEADEALQLIQDDRCVPNAFVMLGSNATGEVEPVSAVDMRNYPLIQTVPFPASALDLCVKLISKSDEEHGSPIIAGRRKTIINFTRKEFNAFTN